MATEFSNLPDCVERKGSLFMRSNSMNYSRATLNSNWHQAREAEPKDYDISKDPVRDLCRATYHRIGNVTDGNLPLTSYEDFSNQIHLKEDFTEKETRNPMINAETHSHVDLDRDTGAPTRGFGSVLPRHHPEHNKQHLETTHKADYKPPYPYSPVPDEQCNQPGCLGTQERPPDFADKSLALKKCHSQFSDTADYRRPGRNTWQDESGLYANSHFKAELYVKTDPFKIYQKEDKESK